MTNLRDMLTDLKQGTIGVDEVLSELSVIERLLKAVDHDRWEIDVSDVDGENWFDLRDEILDSWEKPNE